MFSASSGGKKAAKTGQNWGSQIIFDPSSDAETYHLAYFFDNDSLIDSMSDLIDDREMIQQIWVYKCPLSWWQLIQLLFNHQFVMMETRKWWWSIEKNDNNILIQRSKQLSSVRDFRTERNREPHELEGGIQRRTPIIELSYDKGRKSMKEFIEFLYNKDELNTKYDWMDDNCQDFAKRIFSEFAETKYHEKIFGSW